MTTINPILLTQPVRDYVLFDIETTGLSPETDQVIELSAIKVCEGEVVDEFSTLVNPGVPISDLITDITGITNDMVKDAPSMDVALNEFIKFIGDSVLMGHNIRRFDLKFIQRDALIYRGKELTNEWVDTLIVARRYLPELESKSLESLSFRYGVSYEGAHRALADCYINKKVYDCLTREMAHPSEAAMKVKVCPKCGNVLKRRTGKYGEFWGCTSFPDCRYTEDGS